MKRKIFVIGAGIIGSTYAWLFSEAGHETIHYVRSGKLEQYRQSGIRIDCLDGRGGRPVRRAVRYAPEFTDRMEDAGGADFILVSVNGGSLEAVLRLLREAGITAPVAFMQNMAEADYKTLEQYLEPEQYFFAYPFITGGGKEGDAIINAIFGLPLCHTVLGEKDGRKTKRLTEFAALIGEARMRPSFSRDIVAYLKLHYVWAGCVCAACLAAGGYDPFVRDGGFQRKSYLAMRELWRICEGQGLHPRRMLPYSLFYLPLFLLVPASRAFYGTEQSRRMIEGHIGHSHSEIEAMLAELARMAGKNGETRHFTALKTAAESGRRNYRG